MRYKSCRLLEHGIYIYQDPGTQKICAGHCCNTDHLDFNDRLYLYFNLKEENLNWDYIFSEKRKLRENAKKGIYPSQCDGCFELVENEWDDEDYINHLTAGHIMKCNSRCIYCPTGRIEEWHNREQEFDFLPVINELTEKNLLKYNGSLRFVGGEPTLIKEFNYLVDLFSSHNVPEIYVPTSGIKLSKSLCKAIKKIDSAAIVASIDSGCRETFEKIKGTKFYDIVMKNMKTYLNSARLKNFVILKYILLAGYNDNAKEIEMWLKNCADMGIVEVQFDAEHSVCSSEKCENKKYINRTLKMLKYTELAARKYNIKVNSFLAFMNRAKNIYEKQLTGKYKYKDLYLNIDENIDFDALNKQISEDKFSPERRAFLSSQYKDITKATDFDKKITELLQLGFDLEFTTESSIKSPIIEEILKTSFSTIKFSYAHSLFKVLKDAETKRIYAKMPKLGRIEIV